MFDTVLIAGLGLMGGSMAKTIKARTLSRVLGWNLSLIHIFTLLRGAGVDMASPAPIEDATRLFDELITEMERLL